MQLLFHPTVFDNLKVAIENQIYDYDNLDGLLLVTDRSDLLDLALMSREFLLSFRLTGSEKVTSQIVLSSTVKDLGDEILENPDTHPGCQLLLRFYLETADVSVQCPAIGQVLTSIWGPEIQPVQSLVFVYGQAENTYRNTVELQFNRQITEDQMEDIPELLQAVLKSAEQLEAI
ncbi:hypothetical protein [Paenibacillus albidus]|uniref:hypothetical protein n=1 Tax=Paenibacillus albidus TaxID=2041023 RepID=UPI001E5DC1D9|nr:hypothetical protein [Paenibacillus albidus]